MQSPEEFAREWLGCHVEIVEPGLGAAGTRFCGEHRYPWLHDVDLCPRQERAADYIRARDAEVWDEGHTAGVRNASAEFDGPVQDNPYKRERAES